jgi:hypothetical protein
MKTVSLLTLCLVATVLLSSCSSTSRTIQAAPIAAVEIAPLQPGQYEILAEVTGTGKAGGIGGQKQILAKAEQQAIFDAVSKVQGADALIAPRYERTTSWGWFILPFASANVSVTGKAIRIKPTSR